MGTIERRVRTVRAVVSGRVSAAEGTALLADFPWGCSGELVFVTSRDLRAILRRYLGGDVTALDVREWAELLECRADVGFESESVREGVSALANSVPNGELTLDAAITMLRELTPGISLRRV